MPNDRKRCPFEFKQFCGNQCAWYNASAERCWMLEEINELNVMCGRLKTSVDNNSKVLDGIASSLLSMIKEKRNAISR